MDNSILENPAAVINYLRAASVQLSAAHKVAGRTENGESNLGGVERDMIFALNTAVQTLEEMIVNQND